MRQRVLLALGYFALLICMTAGWHTWPLAIAIGIWLAGYRIHEDRLVLTDRDLEALLRG